MAPRSTGASSTPVRARCWSRALTASACSTETSSSREGRYHDRRSGTRRGGLYPREAQTPCNAGAIGDSAVSCLLMELETWPKPGLVSHVDNGSHDDMDADTFRSSAAAIKPYFQHLAGAAAAGCDMG